MLEDGDDDIHPVRRAIVGDEAASDRPLNGPAAELDCFRIALNRHAIVSYSDRAGRITDANDLFCEVSGYGRGELLGAPHSIVNSGHHPREFFHDMWKTIAQGERWQGEICNRAKDGTLYWVDTTIVGLREGERCRGYVSIRYDVTQRKQAETALMQEMERRKEAEILLRDIIETIPNGIAAFDEHDRLVLFNSTFKECYPRAAEQIEEGVSFETILRLSLDRGEFPDVRNTETARRDWLEERLRRHRNPGRAMIQHLRGDRWLKVQERRSRSGHVVGVRTDVTDLKRAERQIKAQAETDPLTGLANRRLLIDRLEKAMPSQRGPVRPGALILIDLDGFKSVNDTLGHDAGDELLVGISARLANALRRSDLVARLGGDEFAVLLAGVHSTVDAQKVANKILQCFLRPIEIGRKRVNVSGSLGVALFPAHGRRPTDILKHADLALYRAKHEGRGIASVFEPSMRSAARNRATMTEALRTAILASRIEVALQPLRCFATGSHSGFEALARWNWNGNWIPPTDFIELAEAAGLIRQLGDVVMRRAFGALQEMRHRGHQTGTIAVNVAVAQLREPSFASALLAMIAEYGLGASEVTVEVTENVILEKDGAAIGQTLTRLTDAGVIIALDDFGTGYASLSHLKRFPISCLKIDKSFVAELGGGGGDAVIARTIVSLAHSLGMKVVAEGIETPEQYDLLSAMNCDRAQGYLIGRPMLPAEAEAFLKTSKDGSMTRTLRVA